MPELYSAINYFYGDWWLFWILWVVSAIVFPLLVITHARRKRRQEKLEEEAFYTDIASGIGIKHKKVE